MKTWLHFIGKNHYTRHSFRQEAKQYGITRRVGLHLLEKMDFGDRVLLCMMDGKSPVVFGKFYISTVSGLNDQITKSLVQSPSVSFDLVNMGGLKVERGCGEYIEGRTLQVSGLNIRTIAQEIRGVQHQNGSRVKPMIGGAWEDHEEIRLKNVPFTRGFRLFDYTAMQNRLQQWTGNGVRKYPTLKGLFYVGKKSNPERLDWSVRRLIQEVQNYQLN